MQQIGTQEDLYERPATPFVAGFIGSGNMMPGGWRGWRGVAGGAGCRLPGTIAGAGAGTLALRPERLLWSRPARRRRGVRGTVELAAYLGAVREHLVRVGPELRLLVRDPTAAAGRLHAAGRTRRAPLGRGRGAPVRRRRRPDCDHAQNLPHEDDLTMLDRTPDPARRLAGAAAARCLRPHGACADEQVVIATWGGDYANLLKDNIDVPLLKPQGIDVVQDSATRTRASPRCSRSAACRAAPTTWSACRRCALTRPSEAGLLETLDAKKVPNLVHVLPNLRTTFYAPHIYSPQVLIYNPDKVNEPPKTFTDLLDPKWKGKVGVGDINYFYVMMAAALAATGDANKVDAAGGAGTGAEAERQRAAAVSVHGLHRRRAEVGRDRCRRHVAGAGEHVAERRHPGEGVVPEGGLGALRVRHGRAEERAEQAGAYKYLNAMLEPPAQRASRRGWAICRRWTTRR